MACSADTALDAARSIEQLSGAQSIYQVHSAGDRRMFAAKWRLVDIRIPPDETNDSFVACRVAGTATVTRRSSGVSIRRRPTIGAVTYVDGRRPAEWRSEGVCDVWHVYLSVDELRRCAEADLGMADVPTIHPFFAVEEPWLKGFFQMIASEFECTAEAWQSADPLFTAQAEHLLIHHLLHSHSDAATRTSTEASRLHTANALRSMAFKRVQEYIAANLCRDIELSGLAEVACMSTGHFLRCFRTTSGMTPHRYVQEQRLSRARELLLTTSLPVSRIALECGFKTASHLSSKFRAKVGASPTQFRASV